MRLSEAIMLGDMLRRRCPDAFLEAENGQVCGCALGGATLALGHSDGKNVMGNWIKELEPSLVAEYPWFNERIRTTIGTWFFQVCDGYATMESLIDYVRSIEPDCDCNRHNCNCAEQAAAPETTAELVAHP